MGQFKETSFYVDGRGNGWSISLFIQPNRSQLDVNTHGLDLFNQKLMPCLGHNVKATYLRESLRGSPKVSVLGQYGDLTQWAGDPTQEIEQAGSVVLCQCFDATLTHKKDLFLHGVWDTAINAGTLQNAWKTSAVVKAFINELKSGKYYFLGKVGEANELVTAAVQVGRKMQITTANPFFPGPFDGKKRVEVFFKGIDTTPSLPSPVLVTPISATQAITKNNFIVAQLNAGHIRMNTYDLIQISQAFMERATLHRIGRPFKPSAAGRYKRLH